MPHTLHQVASKARTVPPTVTYVPQIATPFNENGLLADWDAAEALWEHAFK